VKIGRKEEVDHDEAVHVEVDIGEKNPKGFIAVAVVTKESKLNTEYGCT